MNLLHDEAVLVLTGPTGSGKSALAIQLAKVLSGEVISADSMQIYRCLNIGTAKVSPEEQENIPHHLYDIRNADERYSVAQFVQDATQLILQILERGHTPIICGGTGQYITALVDGLQFIEEEVNEQEREELRQEILAYGLDQAHRILKELDPQAARRILPEDERRIVRFFEVYQKSGMTSSEVYAYSREKGPDFRFQTFTLWPKRQLLYERINERSRKMFDRGIVAELEAMLRKMPHFPQTQAYQAIGYKEIMPYIEGEVSREEAIEALSQASRRYAKRQYTLFRRRTDFIKIEETDTMAACDKILEIFQLFRQ